MRIIARCWLTVAALTSVLSIAPGSNTAGAASPSSPVVIGQPCRPGGRAVDANGRAAGCITSSTGRFWVWTDPIGSPVTNLAVPPSWSEITTDKNGLNAVPAPRPLTALYADRQAMAEKLVQQVNEWRAAKGVAPLTIDPRLEQLSKFWAERIDDPQFQGRGTVHCPPNLCAARTTELGYMGFGEVIRPWTPMPAGDLANERYFIDSPPHFNILVDARYTHIGFSFHVVSDANGNPQSMVVVGQVGRSR
jgi:Cysteine-rich secretory protein family